MAKTEHCNEFKNGVAHKSLMIAHSFVRYKRSDEFKRLTKKQKKLIEEFYLNVIEIPWRQQ